jgi:glycine/D-amino acid oxidase-like deaminating enzyme
MKADLVIAGGGLGGCAAALAALRGGRSVILTEPTDWLGGQMTQQAVPPDEHQWIESHGCTRSYRSLRNGIRDYYRRHYPLAPAAQGKANLNPGNGSVSRLCHEPRVALIAFCHQRKTEPHAVREDRTRLADFQQALRQQGVELHWPRS